jgi:endonuclease YncB( thermonuclease family)
MRQRQARSLNPGAVQKPNGRALLIAAFAASLFCISAASGGSGTVVLIDGDTLRYDGETIRLVGIDTPESFHSRCKHELVLALAAKERLRQLVDAGPLTVERHGKDRYGRTLARVLVDGSVVGNTLLREG